MNPKIVASLLTTIALSSALAIRLDEHCRTAPNVGELPGVSPVALAASDPEPASTSLFAAEPKEEDSLPPLLTPPSAKPILVRRLSSRIPIRDTPRRQNRGACGGGPWSVQKFAVIDPSAFSDNTPGEAGNLVFHDRTLIFKPSSEEQTEAMDVRRFTLGVTRHMLGLAPKGQPRTSLIVFKLPLDTAFTKAETDCLVAKGNYRDP